MEIESRTAFDMEVDSRTAFDVWGGIFMTVLDVWGGIFRTAFDIWKLILGWLLISGICFWDGLFIC